MAWQRLQQPASLQVAGLGLSRTVVAGHACESGRRRRCGAGRATRDRWPQPGWPARLLPVGARPRLGDRTVARRQWLALLARLPVAATTGVAAGVPLPAMAGAAGRIP